ncbi:MAG: hypothetical protein FWF75_10025, partial [Propionibacteriaceae bacterium]|nr:hypothetical protein [Propionibacteriaceae bacterium]
AAARAVVAARAGAGGSPPPVPSQPSVSVTPTMAAYGIVPPSGMVPRSGMVPASGMASPSGQASPTARDIRHPRKAVARAPLIARAPRIAGVLFGVAILVNVVWGTVAASGVLEGRQYGVQQQYWNENGQFVNTQSVPPAWWALFHWAPWPWEALGQRGDYLRFTFFGTPVSQSGAALGVVAIVSCCALVVACVTSLVAARTRRKTWLICALAAIGVCALPFAIWVFTWWNRLSGVALVWLEGMLLPVVATAVIGCVAALRPGNRRLAARVRWAGVLLLEAAAICAYRVDGSSFSNGSAVEFVPYLLVVAGALVLLLHVTADPVVQRPASPPSSPDVRG